MQNKDIQKNQETAEVAKNLENTSQNESISSNEAQLCSRCAREIKCEKEADKFKNCIVNLGLGALKFVSCLLSWVGKTGEALNSKHNEFEAKFKAKQTGKEPAAPQPTAAVDDANIPTVKAQVETNS